MMKIDIKQWHDLILELCERHKDKTYTGVFGVPRGGTLVAIEVSRILNLEILDKPKEGCLIVDDLIDSGTTKNKYEEYDFDALINKEKEEWIEFWYEDTKKDKEDIIIRMLETIGENPNRIGLKETPLRVTKMWNELFRGYDKTQKPNITVFPNGEDGVVSDSMICDTGNFYSHCEHHMVPFFGKYWFAYIPGDNIVGLSKVARLVDYYAAKLQIQERLVRDIVDDLEKELKPKGIALIMEATHLCKVMRGVKKEGKMLTSEMRGVFKKNDKARNEFINWVQVMK